MKSESLNLLEPSGPHLACYGTPLPLPFIIQQWPNYFQPHLLSSNNGQITFNHSPWTICYKYEILLLYTYFQQNTNLFTT